MTDRTVIVVGTGNEFRGDDGAGIAVVRRLRASLRGASIAVHEHHGEPVGLLDVWRDRAGVVLVDTLRSGAPAGTVRRFDVRRVSLGPSTQFSSTHAFSLEEAIELGRALGRLPGQLIVFAIEGHSFTTGTGLSPEIELAIPSLADEILREATRLAAP